MIGPPAARAAPAQRGVRRRNSPSAVLPARSEGDGEQRPYAGKSDGAQIVWQEALFGSGKPYAGKREGSSAAPRSAMRRAAFRTTAARDATGERSPARDRDGESARTARGDRELSGDDRPARGDRDRTLGDDRRVARREEIRREAALYAARRRLSQGRRPAAREIVPSVRGRHATAIVPVAIGPSENSAATRNFRAARRTAGRARILVSRAGSRDRDERGDSKAVAEARRVRPITRRNSRPAARRCARISTSRVSTSRATTAAAMSVRGFRARARIVPQRAIAPKFDRPRATARRGPHRLAGASAQRTAVARSAAPRQRGRQQDLCQTSGVRRPRRLSRAQA